MIKYYADIAQKPTEVEGFQPSCWICIEPPFTNEEIAALAGKLGIPLDFLTDSLDIDERSRYEREDDVKLIVVNTPILNDDTRESVAIFITAPIGIILLDNCIITITGLINPIITKFQEGGVKNFTLTDHRMFILKIFEQTVFRYLDCLKKLNLRRNLIEQELYNSSRNKELQELLRIEKSLVYFVNSLSSNELLKMKMKRTDFLKIREEEMHTDLFEDIIIDNSQALEMSNVYTNILSGTMEAYASIVSNNLNVFIHRLTLITIILMVPTLVASFFGMNVKFPFDNNNPLTFYVIVILSFLLGMFLLWFFRRRKLF